MKQLLFSFLLGALLFCAPLFVDAQPVVIVEPDAGTDVNALPKAIDKNGDAVYILRRGGVYYLEGRYTFNNRVIIKSEEGSGLLPMIQPIPDANGALPADMLRFNKDVTFENIYFCGKAEMTGNILQRLFRIDSSNTRLSFEGCFIEYCLNFCIRTDGVNNKIYINNSVFRNLALTSDPANGRLIDQRGNAQDTLSITNSTVYNNTGNIIRFDKSITNYVELKNNTFYNIGYHFRVDYAMKLIIENNIFANTGWKAGYQEGASYFDIQSFEDTEQHKMADVRITIRNNNFFTVPQIDELYTKYPGNIRRVTFSQTGEELKTAGQLLYENNISEIITFSNPSPLPMTYIDKFFEVLGTGMASWADLPFYVDENGEPGFTAGAVTYGFNYSGETATAKASTTGGPLGAPVWYPVQTGLRPAGITTHKVFPNPARDVITFRTENNEPGTGSVTIYNLLGGTVLSVKTQPVQTIVDVSSLSAGVYTYVIETGKEAFKGKMIIQ
jgi:hypothetical protein